MRETSTTSSATSRGAADQLQGELAFPAPESPVMTLRARARPCIPRGTAWSPRGPSEVATQSVDDLCSGHIGGEHRLPEASAAFSMRTSAGAPSRRRCTGWTANRLPSVWKRAPPRTPRDVRSRGCRGPGCGWMDEVECPTSAATPVLSRQSLVEPPAFPPIQGARACRDCRHTAARR